MEKADKKLIKKLSLYGIGILILSSLIFHLLTFFAQGVSDSGSDTVLLTLFILFFSFIILLLFFVVFPFYISYSFAKSHKNLKMVLLNANLIVLLVYTLDFVIVFLESIITNSKFGVSSILVLSPFFIGFIKGLSGLDLAFYPILYLISLIPIIVVTTVIGLIGYEFGKEKNNSNYLNI